MNCQHIYQESPLYVCASCGRPTHKIDWKNVAKQHREWIDSGKATFGGWWSI